MSESQLSVSVLTHTPNPLQVCYIAARQCYYKGSVSTFNILTDGTIDVQLVPDKVISVSEQDQRKLITKIIKQGHESVLEHVTFSFVIDGVSRVESHQHVRHRIGSYCLSGDSKVIDCANDGDQLTFTLSELWDIQTSDDTCKNLNNIQLRSVDEDGKIHLGHIKNIVNTGIKPVWAIICKSGKTCKATQHHRIKTPSGWVLLGCLAVGESVIVADDDDMVYAYNDDIIGITKIGNEQTYDIEMVGPYHNFVADGIIVHNSQQSQRFCNMHNFDWIVPPRIKNNEKAYGKYTELMRQVTTTFDELFTILHKDDPEIHEIELNEDIRFILPNATATSFVSTMNLRSLINFSNLRMCKLAQWEIRQVATEMSKLVTDIEPIFGACCKPKCVDMNRCSNGGSRCSYSLQF